MTTENWHTAAIYDLEHTSLSYAEIGVKYGRSRDTIIKLKRLHKVLRRVPVSRNGQLKTTSMKSLSSYHRALGSRLTMFRGNRNYTALAHEFGVSRHILKLMEIGAHDFTLTQLSRISEILGHSIPDIIAPIAGVAPIKRPERKDVE